MDNLQSPISNLQLLCTAIPGPDSQAAAAAQGRLDSLTKPQGSLGQLESLLVRLAACTGQLAPCLEWRVVLVAAADHGVAAEGVSAYPQAVTGQMVLNYLAGGAAINVLVQAAGARMLLADAGVAAELPADPRLRRLGLRRGSGNIAHEPAMSEDEAVAALLFGAALVEEESRSGLSLLALGEMGIANTTPAAALTSAFTGAAPEQTVGRGTGIDDQTLTRKVAVVKQALARTENQEPFIVDSLQFAVPRSMALAGSLPTANWQLQTVIATLANLGGLEIAVLAGATLAAAARRIPVLLDGYITTSAALVAAALAPNVRHHLFAAHRSAEPGHGLALAHLGLTEEHGAGPLLQLGLRLGEGSGAALALPLLVNATRLMRDMATFGEAGVDNRT
ncbi:MAG: nicotinate-nucleotide--dimethylbenzimidazole phosphoribosyltransferase [Chloroflexaceae bacterium]|jgi:nicotinate-nucleotide--dimethylbenzimidazole phosphoribosyltransferase|nr:nicotinate-nucleotide--dimethylbenzimidazole phosphoribosyltransferase [Chloroflexaceae bacterium]